MRNVILAVSISCLIVSIARTSRAQDESPPPVARLTMIDGEASLLRGDETTSWVSATVNSPLGPGDCVFAGPNSRAEIQLDHNHVVRLAGQAQVRLASLTQDRIQIEASHGLIDFVILGDASRGEGMNLEPNSEIDMPNIAVRPLVPGVYRIQVDSNSQGRITVRQGRLEVFSSEGSTTVERGTTITVQGTDSPEYQTAEAESPDDWDRWNEDRDRVTEGISAAPSQDLPEARDTITGDSPPTNSADAKPLESVPSPDSLASPDVGELNGAASSQQPDPPRKSRPGWNRFTPPSAGTTPHRRSGGPDQAMRDRSPGSKADAQPPKTGFEAPRAVTAPGSAGERGLAPGEGGAEPSRDGSVARPGGDAGRSVSNRSNDERTSASVRAEPRTQIAQPAPPQIRSEAPEGRNAAPPPRDAPRDSTNKKN
jgi:hypothetical protein